MLHCSGPDTAGERLAAIQEQADAAAEIARERLALLRDPAAYLPSPGRDVQQAGFATLCDGDSGDPVFWLYGPIVSADRFDLVSPRSVRLALNAATARFPDGVSLRLRVSSPGGCMAGAAQIARLLAESRWRAFLVVEIDHMCHSAAAIHLLPAASQVVMREGASLMLHETSRLYWGRASDCLRIAREQRLEDEADWRRLAEARRIPHSRVRRLALAERFLSAEQAYQAGLVDAILPALPAINREEAP
jgi:ATP-dependent protease ClpP protease subunit